MGLLGQGGDNLASALRVASSARRSRRIMCHADVLRIILCPGWERILRELAWQATRPLMAVVYEAILCLR